MALLFCSAGMYWEWNFKGTMLGRVCCFIVIWDVLYLQSLLMLSNDVMTENEHQKINISNNRRRRIKHPNARQWVANEMAWQRMLLTLPSHGIVWGKFIHIYGKALHWALWHVQAKASYELLSTTIRHKIRN